MKKIAVVDIETSSAKVLIANIGRIIEIEDFYDEIIPREVRSLEDKKIYLKEKLSDIFHRQLSMNNIFILAKGTDIIIRNYTFPAASRSHLFEAVKWKIIEHSHLNEETAVFAYRMNKMPDYRYNAKANVTAAATSPSVIKKYHDYFSFTGYKTPSITLEAEGIRGTALISDASISNKTVAVMHIGNSLTNVVILDKKFLTASRTIPTADENFSRVLVGETIVDGKTVNVTLEEAEIIKKDIGIPMGEAESSAYALVLPPSTITQMLQPLLEGFISEIERFFKFYRTESGTEKIDEILLSGPGTNLKNIDAYFQDKFKIPTRILSFDIRKNFTLTLQDKKKESLFLQSLKSFSPLLGALVCQSEHPGVLKIYEAPRALDKILFSLRRLYTIFIGIIFLAGYIVLLTKALNMRDQANLLEKEWRDLVTNYKDFFILQGERMNQNRTLVAFNELKKASDIEWLDIFREISLLAPEKLVVWTLRIHKEMAGGGQENNVLQITGYVLDTEGRQEEIITDFIVSLSHSAIFRNVDITFTEKDVLDPQITHFEIIAHIAGTKDKNR
ncbi:MAG: pilus assembly protein PilM [Candidatus Aureabacteria bacterium]|nr:pilus assembly protein PilM [Candidatus Auribacterota bacterium]